MEEPILIKLLIEQALPRLEASSILMLNPSLTAFVTLHVEPILMNDLRLKPDEAEM
jgi:hypothetical protein